MSGQSQVIDSIIGTPSMLPSVVTAHPSPSVGGISAVGQSFTGNGLRVTEAKFHLQRSGSSSSAVWVTANIYALSGVFGVSEVPVGAPLATSEPILFNNIPTSSAWVSFYFTNNNVFPTVAGGHYFIVIQCDSPGLASSGPYLLVSLASTAAVSNGGQNRFSIYGSWSGTFPPFALMFELLGVPALYGVTYDANWPSGVAGSGSAPVDSAMYEKNDVVTVLGNTGGLARSNYQFLGWATDSSSNTSMYNSGDTFVMGSENVILYAVWQSVIPSLYPVEYNENGATDGIAPSDTVGPYPSGLIVTVEGQGTLMKTNYTFLGWSTNSSATSAQYTQGSTFQIYNPTTLYAVWSYNTDKVFDGGIISKPLEVIRSSPFLQISAMPTDTDIPSLRQWMYAERPSDNKPSGDLPDYINVVSPGMGLRFTEAPGSFIDLFPFKFTGEEYAPGVAVNRHLIVRKDFSVRGFLKSYEGNIILHGNGPNAVDGNDTWNIGWGPRTGTPFIWLAEGGHQKGGVGGIGGNSAAETLLIVTNNTDPQSVSPEIPGTPGQDAGAYKWGHLEAGKIISHDVLHTDSIGPVVPRAYIGQPSGIVQAFFDTTKIEVYTSLLPSVSGRAVKNLGDATKQWDNLYVKNLHVSGVGRVYRGSATTNSNGEAYIPFSPAFASVPFITVTPRDLAGRALACVVTSRNVSGFNVKISLAAVAHIHKVGTATQAISNLMAIEGESQHFHTLSHNSTEAAGNHSHTITSTSTGHTTSTELNHTHEYLSFVAPTFTETGGAHSHSQINYGSTPQAGPATGQQSAGVYHIHETTMYPATSTNSGGSHSHGLIFGAPKGYPTTSNSGHNHTVSVNIASGTNTVANHAHTYLGFAVRTAGNPLVDDRSHTHGILNKPLFVRSLTFRKLSGIAYDAGGVYCSTELASEDLYTEQATSGEFGVGVAVDFDWIAIL